MKIMKVKNYKAFAENLKNNTGCEISTRIIERNHFHYQLDKDGFPIGVLCVDNGEVSFAPFVTHETAKNEQYIEIQYITMLDELIIVLRGFEELFTYE